MKITILEEMNGMGFFMTVQILEEMDEMSFFMTVDVGVTMAKNGRHLETDELC